MTKTYNLKELGVLKFKIFEFRTFRVSCTGDESEYVGIMLRHSDFQIDLTVLTTSLHENLQAFISTSL
jgi:hypothetical protein